MLLGGNVCNYDSEMNHIAWVVMLKRNVSTVKELLVPQCKLTGNKSVFRHQCTDARLPASGQAGSPASFLSAFMSAL